MSSNSTGWEVAVRVGSLAIEVFSLWNFIKQWWQGRITIWQLLEGIGELPRRLMDRFFNVSPQMSLKNAYDELSVPQGSKDVALIETKFRALALVHHPDKGGSQAKFEEIVTARGIIIASLG